MASSDVLCDFGEEENSSQNKQRNVAPTAAGDYYEQTTTKNNRSSNGARDGHEGDVVGHFNVQLFTVGEGLVVFPEPGPSTANGGHETVLGDVAGAQVKGGRCQGKEMVCW